MKTLYVVIAICLAVSLHAGTPSDDPRSPLFKAIRSGDLAAVQRALAATPDLNSREIVSTKPRLDDPSDKKEELGDTPLMVATRQGSLELVKLLVVHGADVNASGNAGFTPLIEAVRSEHPAIATLLLDKGAKPNQRNGYGDTAIVFAANDGNNLLTAKLLGHGADINGGSGWTPLMEAAYNGHKDTVVLLLQKGANVNLHRGNGMTPEECALVQGRDDIAMLLRNAGGRGRSATILARDIAKEQAKLGVDAAKIQSKGLESRNERVVTAEDQEVIEIALTDLIAYQGADGLLRRRFSARPGKADINLINVTARGPFLFSDDQLNSELNVEQANDVTRDMRVHLQKRNLVTTSLTDFKPRNTHIRLVSEMRRDNRVTSLPDDDQVWVQIFLPGYSQSNDAVVLRFSAGPTAHGMSGTYFLTKSQGEWHVKWRQFAYYV